MLATSFPPLLQLYRTAYHLVTAITVRMFRRYGAIRAIYLRRGGARGEILPLVSDIDFAVIVESMSAAEKTDLFDEYENLVRWTTLLDKSLEVYDEADFFEVFNSNEYARFRFTEGKKTWKLVYGRDYVRELPDLSPGEMAGGFFTEIKVWWALFAWRFFQARKYNDETVTRNNVCYKTVSEVLRMDVALHHDDLPLSRAGALEKAIPFLSEETLPFVHSIKSIPANRYREKHHGIVDKTMGFLLAHLDQFYMRLTSHALAAPLADARQFIDYDRSESHWGEREQSFLDRVVSFVHENWKCPTSSVRAAPGAYFNVDELLLMIEIDPKLIPTVDEVTRLNLALQDAPPMLRERIRIYLLLPHAAFEIGPDDLMKSWQTILFQPCNPDIFDLLDRKDALIDGNAGAAAPGPSWTALVEHFFDEEKTLFYELLDDPAVYKLCGLDFCRIFWKTSQLVILNRSAARGSILYPMTPPAISRALSAEGIAVPDALLALDPIYREELRGSARDVGEFIPAAMHYLREIR